MEPVRKTQWLATGALGLTGLALAALVGRVAWLERHVSPAMREQVERQYTVVIPVPADTGGIFSSDGTLLAGSVRMYNLFADPAFIAEPKGYGVRIYKLEQSLAEAGPAERPKIQEQIDKLRAELTGEMADDGAQIAASQKELSAALAELFGKQPGDYQFDVKPFAAYAHGRPRRFLWLKREVDEDFYARFQAIRAQLRGAAREALKTGGKSKDPAVRQAAQEHAAVLAHALDGVGFIKSMKRVYPMGTLAGNVIGFANQYGGIDGMEHELRYLLKGIPGQMVVARDAAHTTLFIEDQKYTPPDPGRDVWLTINTVIQGIAEQELKKAVDEKQAESGCAIVMDPKSGRILAMTSYPFFDPSHYQTANPDSRRNKAVTDPFEPGSIFKPFVMAMAIDRGVVKPTDVFFGYNGVYHDPTGREVRDDAGYGALTVHDILVKSSNIGMTQIGWKMGIPRLYDAVTRFGFGSRTGAELPGDEKGLVQPLNQWSKGTLTSASFGYAIAATPLQLVRAFATFANDGRLPTPRIIGAVEESPGHAVPWADVAGATLQPQIISPQTAATMRGIMADVLGPHGTARLAVSKLYKMYGKTGTAHIAAGGHGGGAGHGYTSHFNDYNSSFMCAGPLENPKLVLIVTLHKPRHGYFGGTVSAPAAVAIMERSLMYMGVPPMEPALAKAGR